MFTITAVIPVLNRPKNVSTFINSILDKSPKDKVEILFVTDKSCVDEINEINKFSGPITIGIADENTISWAKRINWGINYSLLNYKLLEKSTWILCGADDIVFHDNWFEEAEKFATDFSGVIGTNDLGNHACINGIHTTHPIVSRHYVENFGTIDNEKNKLCHEGYDHNFVDLELVQTAKKRNAWKHNANCKIEHNHPAWNKAANDDIYIKGQAKLSNDRNLWIKRKQAFNLD